VGEDTLEVWSPGLLPEGVSIADIEREGHVSRPRNPALAQMFYFAGFIERWGVGTTLIQRACRLHDLPAPVFQENMGGFKVSLSQNPYTPERLRGLGLSDRHLAIVLHLREHGTITNSEVQRLTGVSKATATRDLDYLVTHGMLVLQGRTGRGSPRYVLKGS
jgi:ATP-dependent DNA helicase RecG